MASTKVSDNRATQAAVTDSHSDDPDFSDRRTFLVRHDDPRLMKTYPLSACGMEQSFDSPIWLIVGPLASGERCAKLASRYNLSTSEVTSFRDFGEVPARH